LQGISLHGDLLELGSGSGAMAEQTARTFPDLRLTVTDIDPAMVKAAGRRLSGSQTSRSNKPTSQRFPSPTRHTTSLPAT